MRIILAGVGIFLPLFLLAQSEEETISASLDSAEFYQYINLEKTIQFAESAEKLINSSGPSKYAHHLIRSYQIKITSSVNFYRIQSIRQYLEKASVFMGQFRNELGPTYEPLKRENRLAWAEYYYLINDQTKSLPIFTEVIEELKRLPNEKENCKQLYRVAQYIAAIHNRQGEFEAAINQHLTSLSYYECYRDLSQPGNYTLAYRNIGQVYLQKKDYKMAKKYFDKAEFSLKNYVAQSPKPMPASTIFSFYEALTLYYKSIGKYDSAWIVFQRATPLIAQHEPFRGRFYFDLGEVSEGVGNYTAAQEYYAKAIKFFLEYFGSKDVPLSRSYLATGKLLEKQNQDEEAARYFQRAITSLVLDAHPESTENPVLRNILSKNHLFSALRSKSRLLEKSFTKTKRVSFLNQAFETNQLSLTLLDSTANEFSLDKDKIILSEQSFGAFEDGIRIANKLYQITGEEKYFNSVLSLIEKSKGVLLLENLRLVNRFSGIKQEWLEREKELKAEMLLVEQALYQSELKEDKPEHVQQTRERYASLKGDYDILINQIKKEAPDYYKLRFDHSVVSAEIIQNQILKSGETLIEFFVGDSTLAIAAFTTEKKFLTVEKLPPDFTEDINQLRKLLTSTKDIMPGPEFEQLSKKLYELLLKESLTAFGQKIKSIIIIPDGLLGYLPFEALIQPNTSTMVYMNNAATIRYANSATYLIEQMQRKSESSKNIFAGFVSSGAEQSESSERLSSLQGAEHEVSSITEIFQSRFTIFNPANKHDFINHASDYKILHFAMHSTLNDENPMMSAMVFSKSDSAQNLLTAIELYSMKLNSELAVLSACNTGVGQLHRGEGIMSFSRAFSYAGVPSAVISLWKVPDIATSKIMVYFYKYLKAGEAKDRALQLAKLDFVRDNPAMTHPYYWSGFILTGNNEPLNFSEWNQWLWIAIISTVGAVILFAGRKKILQRLRKSSAT